MRTAPKFFICSLLIYLIDGMHQKKKKHYLREDMQYSIIY